MNLKLQLLSVRTHPPPLQLTTTLMKMKICQMFLAMMMMRRKRKMKMVMMGKRFLMNLNRKLKKELQKAPKRVSS